jgi:hypothetical protein
LSLSKTQIDNLHNFGSCSIFVQLRIRSARSRAANIKKRFLWRTPNTAGDFLPGQAVDRREASPRLHRAGPFPPAASGARLGGRLEPMTSAADPVPKAENPLRSRKITG